MTFPFPIYNRKMTYEMEFRMKYNLVAVVVVPSTDVGLVCLLLLGTIAYTNGGARGVVVIVVGKEHGNTSSNPGRD